MTSREPEIEPEIELDIVAEIVPEAGTISEPDSLLTEQLDLLLRRLGSESTSVISGVFDDWHQLVGDAVAKHVNPIKLEAGRLLVEVDEPAWATQMRFLESEIIGKLSQHTGNTISGIDVRVKRDLRAT